MMGTQGIKSDAGVAAGHSAAIAEKASGMETLKGECAGQTNISPQDNLDGVFEQAKSVIVNYKNTIIQDAKNIKNLSREFNDLDKQMSGKVQVAFN